MDLPAGRMVGVIGPDGVGKSTLFSLVAGARAIQSGRIEVLGGDMADARHRRRVCPRIAYMPQGLGKNLGRGCASCWTGWAQRCPCRHRRPLIAAERSDITPHYQTRGRRPSHAPSLPPIASTAERPLDHGPCSPASAPSRPGSRP